MNNGNNGMNKLCVSCYNRKDNNINDISNFNNNGDNDNYKVNDIVTFKSDNSYVEFLFNISSCFK